LQRTLARVEENYRPVSFEDTEIDQKVRAIEDQISGIIPTSIVNSSGGNTSTQTGYTSEQQQLKNQLAGYLSSLKSVKTSVGTNGQALSEFKKYSDSLVKIKKFDDGATEKKYKDARTHSRRGETI